VDDLADQRSTMAVDTAMAARPESAYAVAEERDLHQRIPVAGEGEHGLKPVRRGHPGPSIDPVPKIGRRSMQEPTGDVQKTGTLPGAADGSVPLVDARERRERPSWVQDARAGIGEPGKYLAYEDSGRHVLVPISREWTRIGRSLAADLRFDDATVSRRQRSWSVRATTSACSTTAR
jgi:hypothetical protein